MEWIYDDNGLTSRYGITRIQLDGGAFGAKRRAQEALMEATK